MSNHTPGPWLHVEGTHFVGTDDADTQTICYTDDHRNRRKRSQAEHEANARLIAAAPELLEALKGLINVCTHPQSTKADMKQIAREARAAIAKAEGELKP